MPIKSSSYSYAKHSRYSSTHCTTRENAHASRSNSIANATTRNTPIASTHSSQSGPPPPGPADGGGDSVIAMVRPRACDVKRIMYGRCCVAVLVRSEGGSEGGGSRTGGADSVRDSSCAAEAMNSASERVGCPGGGGVVTGGMVSVVVFGPVEAGI